MPLQTVRLCDESFQNNSLNGSYCGVIEKLKHKYLAVNLYKKMGNSASQEEVDKVGYRVLGVQPNSPGCKCGLVAFFDIIICANGIPLKSLDSTFIDVIKASEEKTLTLTIYNTKSNTTRDISLIPNRNWPGEGMLGN